MNEKISADEVTKRTLSILQSSDFAKTLESFSNEKIKPTMRLMAKIKKRKKS